MTKRKTRREAQQLFDRLLDVTGANQTDYPEGLPEDVEFHASLYHAQQSGENLRMKKFRFQLLHQWLVTRYEPCRVADVGGGKGLLAWMLQNSGWDAAVIDPEYQTLPDKYKDIALDQRVMIPESASVPHVTAPFAIDHAQGFDLLVGMHAHGCNVKIIDAAAHYGCSFVLLPCCIIDEPLIPEAGVHWLECLAQYAMAQGIRLRPFRLNFSGQNIGFYAIKAS